MKNHLYLLLFLLVIFTKCASDKTAEEREDFVEYILEIQKQVSEEFDVNVLFSETHLGNQTARFMLSGRDK